MKKRFLPFSLLLVIMIFGQSVMADQGGHYVPRVKANSAEAFLSTMRVNQQTGMIDPAWLIAASKQVESSAKDGDMVYWKSMGPDNAGGRTTSVVYNNQNPLAVYIGSMGGGVFWTWNNGISWHQVGDNLMVSCMAQAEDGTIYVGTGDCGEAYNYNGLANFNYSNSFIGSGLYKLNPNDNTMALIEGTTPADNNDPEGEWSFINDVAVDGNTVIVATSDGLRYLDNGTWAYAKHDGEDLVGSAIRVKVASDHTIVASVDGKIYIGALDNLVCKSSPNNNDIVGENGIDSIATATGLLDIAIAPSDPNVIYAATISNSGNTANNHVSIYLSEDQGNTWAVVLPTVTDAQGHQVFGARGLYNHGLVVDPQNPDRLYVLGKNLWLLERPTSQTNGYYMALQLSSAGSLHNGLNAMVFSPMKEGEAYIGTDGGIFKAKKADATYLSFVNCNRGYISTRCLSIAPSGSNTRVVGGVLEHGPVLIEGKEDLNNMQTGELLLPELTGALYGSFSDDYNPGFCVVSLIQPKAIIATTVDGALWRTEDGGVNYDFANFTANLTPSYTGYRMPIGYWECFDDEYNTNEVWFKCMKDQKAGDVVQCFSDNGAYPFDYVLPIDMHYDSVTPAHSDSLLVHDPVSTKMVVPSYKSSTTYDIYYTTQAIQFSKPTEWYKITTVTGYPTSMAFSKDGDVLYIGTLANGLYRVDNLRQAVDAYTCHPDSANFAPVMTPVELPTTDQCVTSISFYSEDANKLVVTLGNYGNENYVLYSSNALSDAPTFSEKQGNLPVMPVYSSVYTSTYDGANQGHVMIGTDHGVYRTTNIAASSPVWTLVSDNMGDVPVLDLKQQLISKDSEFVTTIIDEVPYVTEYVGTNNQGVIYAATYGRGLFRCETYRQESGTSVPETPAVLAETKVSMYPNPVKDAAKVSFELNTNTTVSYQVYDMSGRMVKVESLGNYTEGKHEVNVSMGDLAKGAYLLRLNAGSSTSSVKFMVF